MSTQTPNWGRLLAALDEPAIGQVAESLADSVGIDTAEAYDRVEAAVDAGDLVEDTNAGMFGVVRLPESDDRDGGELNQHSDTEGGSVLVKDGEDTVPEDETPTPEAGKTGSSTPKSGETAESATVEREAAVAALRDVLQFYNDRVDDEIGDHTATGEHPDRPTTAREYFTEVRGWDAATVDDLLLGWAPADHIDQLVAYLFDRGHSRAAMLATGAIGESDRGGFYSTFTGRYVLPYYDASGEPAYAIARCSGGDGGGAKGYGGHPADYQAGKYAKLRHTDERVPFDEPIYGLDTLDAGEHVVVAEGIADAITAREAGYAVLSPVTKEFKQAHYDPFAAALESHDVERVTVVADADSIRNASAEDTDPETIREAVGVSLSPTGAGIAGALRTASKLGDRTDVDIRVVLPPAPADTTNDLDEFVTGPWNGDLGALLRSAKPAASFPELESVIAPTDKPADAFDDFDPDEYEPTATEADETTDDIRDIFTALDRLNAQRVADRTIVGEWLESSSATNRTFAPTWAPSGYSGTAVYCDGDKFVDTGDRGGKGGPAAMAAIDAGLVRDTQCPEAVSGKTWFDAVDHLRGLGFSIPKLDQSASDQDAEHTAVLPPAVRDLSTATSGWDWRHTAEQSDDDLSVDAARERTTEAIGDAYGSGDRVLIEALPTMGKSYGAIAAAAETGEQVTVLTGRGRKEQYSQFKQWSDEHGLDYYQLPSFAYDCETANGEFGAEWADTVMAWYRRGATPKQIHKAAESVLGEALPCQQEDHGCTYTSKWDFDPDDYDVLIGHYSHAYRADKVVNGRTVVVDEFPNAYETEIGPELQGAVSYWLSTTPGIPFDSWTGLIENRDDSDRRGEALAWFDEVGVDADEGHVFDDPKAHAAAPLAVYTLLAGEGLENGFETADLGDAGIGAFDRGRGAVSVLRPPELTYASAVVALDGTPTKRMWEMSLGERLNHRPVLQDDERTEYIQAALNLNLIRTTEYVKPYNSADHVNTDADAALLEAIGENHDERPGVITTTTAESEYDAAGVLDVVDETKHYGNVLGSNEFKAKRVGAVIGSNHYGDGYLKKWGAYAGETVERNDEKGSGLSYGGFGDKVLTHMREHDTLQAAMRFGRDAGGAVVYVHTDTLPDWVPIADEGRVVSTWSDGMRAVVAALKDLGTATTAEIVKHEAVDLSRQQVFDHLETLRDRGVLDREQDPDDGRRLVWLDDGIHRLGEHGDVDLGSVDFDDLDGDEVRQVARSSIYTWEFTNFSEKPPDPPSPMRSTSGGDGGADHAAGDTPPDRPIADD